MGPGPSDVPPRVLAAMARPTIGHLDPSFITMMDETQELLRYAFQTRNFLTMPISGPGSAGMEACFVNLVEPGDEVIICENGVFGGRMRENAQRCGARLVVVEDAWGDPVDARKVEDALRTHPVAKLLALVHAETSTGVASDVRTLAEIAHQNDCLILVDAVTSLGGSPLEVDAWDVDAVYSGSQKCLSCTPGLSPISFSDRATEVVRNRRTKAQSWFLDLNLIMDYWGTGQARSYHHTAPINALYGLHEALLALHEEGLEHAWARHARNHHALRAGLEAMGLSLPVAEAVRLPQLNVVQIPVGVDEALVRRRLLAEYGIEIGAGLGRLGARVWRIGLMGYSSNARNVLLCLNALETILQDLRAPIETGVANAAANRVLAAGVAIP
jgi:alanine-glyoxylate transaminase/serine-glyoxylate transaminase/serine-pyruvate transaminase